MAVLGGDGGAEQQPARGRAPTGMRGGRGRVLGQWEWKGTAQEQAGGGRSRWGTERTVAFPIGASLCRHRWSPGGAQLKRSVGLSETRHLPTSASLQWRRVPPCSKSRFLFSGALRPAPSPRPPSCDKRYPPTLVEFVELSHTLTHSLAAATVCVRVAPAVCLSTTLRRLWCRDTLPRASTYPFRRPREIIGPATETPRCCPAAGPSC